MAPWVNRTVAAICDGIDADAAHDRLPVLADAVEDAGCPDPAVAAFLRADHPPHVKRFYRRVVEGHATPAAVLAAVAWLTEHGRAVGTDEYEPDDDGYSPAGDDPFGWLMGVCRGYVTDGEVECFPYDTPDEAFDRAKQMWDQYEVLTGERPADEGTGRDTYPPVPFRCAC